ncbi:MAG TPA: DUF2947 family protein [Thermoguttaceae bacterium]|nr:DUF2947 family protein [Thermoguttaceae bacterium]
MTSIHDRLTTISMDDFALNWRFNDPKYDVLPTDHLAHIHPLDDQSASAIWQFIMDSDLHRDFPFKNDFFRTVESVSLDDSHDGKSAENSRIRKWLYRCAIPFQQTIFLSWQPTCAVVTNSKMLVEYWTSFYYPISDDLTVVDESLDWSVLFFHEHEIHYGTNLPRNIGGPSVSQPQQL